MNDNVLIGILKGNGVTFSPGLTETEIKETEELYQFTFPPDLKALLSLELPISNGFVNWRDRSKENIEQIKHKFNWPLEGMIFDCRHNGFWLYDWGAKPETMEQVVSRCIEEYQNAPKLIPIYSHRYIPATPFESGNPVFSVHQTDIIIYGENLTSYLLVEFNQKQHADIDFNSIKKIPFWSYFTE